MRRPNTKRCPVHDRPLQWITEANSEERKIFGAGVQELHYRGHCDKCGERVWPVKVPTTVRTEATA